MILWMSLSLISHKIFTLQCGTHIKVWCGPITHNTHYISLEMFYCQPLNKLNLYSSIYIAHRAKTNLNAAVYDLGQGISLCPWRACDNIFSVVHLLCPRLDIQSIWCSKYTRCRNMLFVCYWIKFIISFSTNVVVYWCGGTRDQFTLIYPECSGLYAIDICVMYIKIIWK